MTGEQFTDPMRDAEGYLTPEQFETLISYAKSERDRVLLSFIFYTGRRVSEVVRCLKPENFNYKDNMVLFTILKRRKLGYRTWINISQRATAMMRDYIERSGIAPDEYIFSINRFRVNQILYEMGKKAAPVLGWRTNENGVPFVGKNLIHVHILRHSFAIELVKNMPKEMDGLMKLRLLQSAMGHGNINSSNWYIDHFGDSTLKETLEKM